MRKLTLVFSHSAGTLQHTLILSHPARMRKPTLVLGRSAGTTANPNSWSLCSNPQQPLLLRQSAGPQHQTPILNHSAGTDSKPWSLVILQKNRQQTVIHGLLQSVIIVMCPALCMGLAPTYVESNIPKDMLDALCVCVCLSR